jgi:hypothetical protein
MTKIGEPRPATAGSRVVTANGTRSATGAVEPGVVRAGRYTMERSMKSIALTLALLATTAFLPGCVFAVGSKLETDQTGRLKKLEQRISNAEKQLGITPAPMPAADDTQVPQ